MTILLAFPSSAMSFFLIFVLLELDSDLCKSTRSSSSNDLEFWRGVLFFLSQFRHFLMSRNTVSSFSLL